MVLVVLAMEAVPRKDVAFALIEQRQCLRTDLGWAWRMMMRRNGGWKTTALFPTRTVADDSAVEFPSPFETVRVSPLPPKAFADAVAVEGLVVATQQQHAYASPTRTWMLGADA